MPNLPPPVDQTFVNQINACTGYNADHNALVTSAGTLAYPFVNLDVGGKWRLGTNGGDKISAAAVDTLKSATPQTDGSYVDTNNHRWWLEPNVPSAGWCDKVAF